MRARKGRRLMALMAALMLSVAAMAQHHLKEVFVYVVLQPDGSAEVTEMRWAEMGEQGTEGFITFNNMGDIEVKDLQVTDEKKTEYVVEKSWDVNRSREAKTNHCGYHYTNEGVELCWGIGDAGDRIYTIKYTLTNLVKAYEDNDGFCHSFYEAANSPADKVIVTLHVAGDSLTKQNARLWTFGYEGRKGFLNNFAYAATDSLSVRKGDGVIVLLQLEKGVLNPAVKREGTFKELVKRPAMVGSDYNLTDAGLENGISSLMGGDVGTGREDSMPLLYEQQPEGEWNWGLIVGFLIVAGLIGWAASGKIKDGIEERKRLKEIYERLVNLLGGKKYTEMPYYRNLPQEGNLLRSSATLAKVAYLGRMTGHPIPGLSFGLQNLYEAFVLRMFYKGGITIDTDVDKKGNTRKLFRIKEPVKPAKGKDVMADLEDITIESSRRKLVKARYGDMFYDDGVEYAVQRLLYQAAGEDHLLQPDELRVYVKENAEEWRPLADMLGIFGDGKLKSYLLASGEVQQVVGFWHYLKDFSLVGERYLEEVNLWKEYLVFASFYGMADQVRRDMKKVAPDVTKLEELIAPLERFKPITTALASSISYARSYETVSERHARERRERAAAERAERESSYERSSGGSGRSSYSGGGGHSGGGGSGFR